MSVFYKSVTDFINNVKDTEIADVLSGQSEISRIEKDFANDIQNQKQFKQMAKNAQAEGKVLSQTMARFENSIRGQNGNVVWEWNEKTRDLTAYIIPPGANYDTMDNTARRELLKHTISIPRNGTSKVNGLPASVGRNIHVSFKEGGNKANYFTTAATDSFMYLEDISRQNWFQNKMKKGDVKSLKSAVKGARKAGMLGLVAYQSRPLLNQKDINEEYNAAYSGDGPQAFKQNQQLRVTIASAAADIFKKRANDIKNDFRNLNKQRSFKDVDIQARFQNDIWKMTAIMTSYPRDKAIALIKNDKSLSYITKGNSKLFSAIKDDMNLLWGTHSTVGMGSDTNKGSGVMQYGANQHVAFAGVGDSSRHLSQATNRGVPMLIDGTGKGQRYRTKAGITQGYDYESEAIHKVAYVGQKEIADLFTKFRNQKIKEAILNGQTQKEAEIQFLKKYGAAIQGLHEDSGLINENTVGGSLGYFRPGGVTKSILAENLEKYKNKIKNYDKLTEEERLKEIAHMVVPRVRKENMQELSLAQSEDGNYQLHFDELIMGKSGDKGLGTLTGTRETLSAVSEELFEYILKELGIDKNVQVLRQKKSIKENQIVGIFNAFVENLLQNYNDTSLSPKEREAAEKTINDIFFAKDSPFYGMAELKDGELIIDSSWENQQKINTKKIVDHLSKIGILSTGQNGELSFKGGHLTIAEAITGSNLYEYRKGYKVGEKERDAARRTIGMVEKSGNNVDVSDIKEQVEKRLAVNDKQKSRALKNKEKIDEVIAASIDTKLGDISNDKNYVSIGVGEDYDINIQDFIDKIINYGDLTEEELNKTIWGQMQSYVKSHPELDSSKLKFYVDTGRWGGGVDYGKSKIGVTGDKLFIPNLDLTKLGKNLDDEETYAMPQIGTALSSLFHAMAEGKGGDIIASRAMDAYQKIVDTAYSKDGSIYKELNQQRLDNSHSFKANAINPESVKQIEDITLRNMYENGVMLSREDWENLLSYKGKKNTQEYQSYIESLKDNYKTLYGNEYDGDLNKTSDIISKILDAITEGNESFTGKGLALAGLRFPSINGQDLKFLRGYVGQGVTSGHALLGSNVFKGMSGDFDGDMINLAALLLRGKGLQQFEKIADVTNRINKSVSAAVWQDKPVGDTDPLISEQVAKNIGVEDVTKAGQIIAKINKEKIGTFSNVATRVRGALKSHYMDESTGSNVEDIGTGILVRSFFETLEQDAISSKKVEDRIIQQYSKQDLSAEDKIKFIAEKFGELDEVIEKIFDPNAKLEDGKTAIQMLLEKMQEMGIFKNSDTLLQGKTAAQAIAEIQSMQGGEEWLRKIGFTNDQLFQYDKNGNVINAGKSEKLGTVSNESMRFVLDRAESLIGSPLISGGGKTWGVGALSKYAPELAHGIILVKKALEELGKGDLIKPMFELAEKFGLIETAVTSAKDAIKQEKEAEMAKIGVAKDEATVVQQSTEAWKKYSKSLEGIVRGRYNKASYVDTLQTIGMDKTSVSAIKGIHAPYVGGTTGLDVETLLKQGKKQSWASLVQLLGLAPDATKESVGLKYLTTAGGDLAHSVAQTGLFSDETRNWKEKISLVLEALGWTSKKINEAVDKYLDIGNSISLVAKQYGEEIGHEVYGARASSDGKYLIGGRMDSLRHGIVDDKDVYTVLDYKTRSGGKISADDIEQTLQYVKMLQDLQTSLKDGGAYSEDVKKAMMSGDTSSLINKISTEIIDVNKFRADKENGLSATEVAEKARLRLVENLETIFGKTGEGMGSFIKGRIQGGVVVSNSKTGETQAYDIVSNITNNILKILENMTGVRTAADNVTLLGQAQIHQEGGYYIPGKKIPQTKEQKEADKKAKQEAFNKALEEEYKIRFKIEELKAKQGKAPSEDEKKNYQTLLDYQGTLLKNQEKEVRKAGKGVSSRYKNDLLSAKNAELDLYKGSLKNKNAGGGSQEQSLLDSLGYNKQNLTRMITQYFSLWRVLGKVQQEIRRVVQVTKQLDQAATNIRIVTGMNRQEVDNAILSYSNLADALGTTTTALAQSANEWLRQGYSISESVDLITATTQLSKLGMLDMNSATKVLTSTLKGFKMQANEASSVVDKLTKLDMNYAASAGEIGEAMSRTSAIASQMGLSIDETAAMVTTIMDVTQQSAEMAGTAVRSILSRYGNVKAGSFVSMMTEGEDLERINDIEKVLSVLGISIRNSKMEMRDMGEVLDELAKKWNTLSSVEQNAVATAFAGTRQRNQFQVLLSNWNQVREAQEISASSVGTAAEKYEAQMESIEASINKVQNAWESLTQKIGSSKTIKGFLDVTAQIVKHFDKILVSTTSMLTAVNAYKLNFGSFKGFTDKPTNNLNIMHMKSAGSTMQKSNTGTTVTKINTNVERLITIANKIAGNVDAQTSTPGFFSAKHRASQNKENREKIRKLQAQSNVSQDDQQEIDRLKNQNRFNRRWDAELGYATQNKKGETIFAIRRGKKWIDPNGNIISDNSQVSQLNEQRKNFIKNQFKVGVATGAVAGLGGYMTGPRDTFGMFKTKDISIDDIQSDETDKIINGFATGTATGLLSAIPGIGPILGPILGPIIGDGIGGLFKWLRHKDDIERKQRVEDAKKNLEALNKIQGAVNDVSNSVYDLSTAMAVQSAKASIDKLIDAILTDENNREEIMAFLKKEGVDSIADLENLLLSNDDERKKKVLNVLEKYTTSGTASSKRAAQEEDRYQAQKAYTDTVKENVSGQKEYFQMKSGLENILKDVAPDLVNAKTWTESNGDYTSYYVTRDIYGGSDAEENENRKELIKRLEEYIAKSDGLSTDTISATQKYINELKTTVKAYGTYQGNIEAANRDLWQSELTQAFVESGLSNWSGLDVKNTSLEDVVQRFANNLRLTGQSVRNYGKEITSAARTQIETYLRANDKFNILFTGSTETLNDLMAKEEERIKLVDKIQKGLQKSGEEVASSFDDITKAFNTQSEEDMEKFAKAVNMSTDELQRLVYKLSDDSLDRFARALNMTEEEIKRLSGKLGSITISELLQTPEEVRSSMSDLVSMFGELTSTGTLSGEMLEKLNSKYFDLYNLYDESGKIINTDQGNIRRNLRQRLFGSSEEEGTQAFLYQNATYQALKENSDFLKAFKAQVDQDIYDQLTDEQKKIYDTANTLSDMLTLLENNGAMQNSLAKYMNALNLSNSYYQELQSKLVEWQKHENETVINNLQSQIDALNDINKEREIEIKLIKAKEKLENAKTEKKKIYRAGIGWTYEADQEAVSDAKDELKQLEREKDVKNIQYQVDLLEQQNNILDNISKNEQLEALKENFDEYSAFMKGDFGHTVQNIFSEISALGSKDRGVMKWDGFIELMGKQAKRDQFDAENNLATAFTGLYKTQSELNEMIAGKTDAEKSVIQGGSDYKAKQEMLSKQLENYRNAKETLEKSGYSASDINEILKASGAQLGNRNMTTLDESALDQKNHSRMYKVPSGLGKDGSVKEEDMRYIAKSDDVYTSDQINKALEYMAAGDADGIHVNALIEDNAGNPVWGDRITKISDLMALKDGTLVHFGEDDKKGFSEYAVKSGTTWNKATPKKWGDGGWENYADGVLSLPTTSFANINELGTEGIVTPSGTLTALPSKTGIVPADLTKNLYTLGEVAPNLIKRFENKEVKPNGALVSNEDNSMFIQTLNASFEAGSDFDFEKLITQARQYINMTKNQKRW